MTSGGGITTTETAIRFPVRLVESGPAAARYSPPASPGSTDSTRSCRSTWAAPRRKSASSTRRGRRRRALFEVARIYRFVKGSGLPLRIPVIEMVEIGAGGGSIARVDALGRIAVGPHSAGSEPGPVCYGRGGTEPTVTDADVALGRIDPATIFRRQDCARRRRRRTSHRRADRRQARSRQPIMRRSASAKSVDENMANAARVHAIESGKDLRPRTLIAFGGAAPLHAARVAEKLGIGRVLIPANAGVGSAVGLLRAPVAYEIVRGRLMRLSSFDAASANRLLAEMRAEAEAIVRRGAPDAELDRAAIGVHALSRPGPRDRGASFRCARSPRPIASTIGRTVRGGLSPALQPPYSRRRDRDFELGARGRASGGRRARGRGVGSKPADAEAAIAPRRSLIRTAANSSTCRSIGGRISRPVRASEARR